MLHVRGVEQGKWARWTRHGFATMVDYTAPVLWCFFLLAGPSLFVLHTIEPQMPRPSRIPLAPLTPLVCRVTCVYVRHSSLAYTNLGRS
jgi:basic amino acid/polyamine antiporter, APA family